MNKSLPFFNWSLKNALDTEPDSFIKARIRIIYTILIFSIFKGSVVIGFGIANEQWLQVVRASIAFSVYITLIKILLHSPKNLKLLAQMMLSIGCLIVWTNIFIYAHNINLVTIQFVFMIVLGGFYTLGSGWGIMYSVFSITPVMLFLFTSGNQHFLVQNTTQELASPGFETIVILNFITIVVSHYLFFRASDVNIKEKEKLNKQLQLSVEEAHKLSESKSNFLSTMSHELRTPLNSVIGITELLLEDNPEERQKENLKILHFSTLDLLSLINNVLDFNKIDSDKLVLEAVPFQLDEFMEHISSTLKVKANDKKLDFILDIDKELAKTVILSDPTRLSQIIYNLAGNAIKFTEKGSITIKLDCTNRTEHNVDVLFSVQDTGIGIHADRHNTIFELFSQAESHITRKYGGTGLGLAIVKQILGLFNSTIQLESSPDNGSRFFFTIAFKLAKELNNPSIAIPVQRSDFSHLRILVAEDNDVNRLIIRKQFDKLNIKPVVVENGKLALDEFLSGDFDAIFMDLHMPVSDGYETTKKIRSLADAKKAKVHIIAFTASVTEQQQILDTGFDDYLYKPVNMGDLSDKLEKIAGLNPK